MKELVVDTGLGNISVAIEETNSTSHPIIFMHGVFLDISLWKEYPSEFTQKNHIYSDMPAHGKSSDVGHSWGSMTALRAAVKFPDRFEVISLFNMPHKKTTGLRKLGFTFQKMMLVFPKFYAKHAAKLLYSKSKLSSNPELSEYMQNRLSRRSVKELARIIDSIIINPDDATGLIEELTVPALAIIGEEDYVGKPHTLDTWTVPGGHISPHESVKEIKEAIVRVLALNENRND